MSNIDDDQQTAPAKKRPKCPTCGAPADPKARPFCSTRCAEIDLGHWFQGKYAIPAVDAADDTIIEALLATVDLPLFDDGEG